MMNATSRTAPLMSGGPPGSGHLEGDSLDYAEHVLAPVGAVRAPPQQPRQLVAQQAVGFVLETVDLDGVLLVEGRERAQAAHRTVRLLGRLYADLCHGVGF